MDCWSHLVSLISLQHGSVKFLYHCLLFVKSEQVPRWYQWLQTFFSLCCFLSIATSSTFLNDKQVFWNFRNLHQIVNQIHTYYPKPIVKRKWAQKYTIIKQKFFWTERNKWKYLCFSQQRANVIYTIIL